MRGGVPVLCRLGDIALVGLPIIRLDTPSAEKKVLAMSLATHETVYHLTPKGWTGGPEPTDRVESWRRTVSDDHWVSWRCDWVDLARENAERDALREKFQAFMTSAAIG